MTYSDIECMRIGRGGNDGFDGGDASDADHNGSDCNNIADEDRNDDVTNG